MEGNGKVKSRYSTRDEKYEKKEKVRILLERRKNPEDIGNIF